LVTIFLLRPGLSRDTFGTRRKDRVPPLPQERLYHEKILATGLLHFSLAASLWAATATDQPGGWASLNSGTKGGAGGTEVTVSTMADLQKYAKMTGKGSLGVTLLRGG